MGVAADADAVAVNFAPAELWVLATTTDLNDFFKDNDQGHVDHKLTFEANSSTPNVIVLGISEANDKIYLDVVRQQEPATEFSITVKATDDEGAEADAPLVFAVQSVKPREHMVEVVQYYVNGGFRPAKIGNREGTPHTITFANADDRRRTGF